MSNLLDSQMEFSRALPRLLDKAFELGYDVTLGDAYRDKRCHYGAKYSNHKRRLAIDLNLFKDGKYLSSTEDHRELGEWWMREFAPAGWGGLFNDGNHYEWIHGVDMA